MLRIDLMPQYVLDRRRNRGLLMLLVVLLALEGLGCYAIVWHLKNINKRFDEVVAAKEEQVAQITLITGATTSIKGQTAVVDGKITWVRQLDEVGPALARQIENVNKFIPAYVRLDTFSIDGDKLTLALYAREQAPGGGPRLRTVVGTWMNFMNPDNLEVVGSSVKPTGLAPTGWSFPPAAGGGGEPAFALAATLKNPVTLPAQPGVAPAGGVPGAPGAAPGAPGAAPGAAAPGGAAPGAPAKAGGEKKAAPAEEEKAAGKPATGLKARGTVPEEKEGE